ncbi:MAG: hypothetical protein KDD40_09745, partial [Bdellovibrionales bacterium]|nr:hypothetical protein [Bdellovibrionales bacterium]
MFRYICIFLSLLCCTFGWAQDFSDDIEEAQPLIQGSTSSVEYDVKKWNHRSYTLLGYANVKNTNSNHYESYYAEFDTTVKYESSKKLKSFFDIYAAYLENGDEDVFYVNQLGMSYQIDLKNQFGFGKERRRISPGFIFSPSDIVHVQESL